MPVSPTEPWITKSLRERFCLLSHSPPLSNSWQTCTVGFSVAESQLCLPRSVRWVKPWVTFREGGGENPSLLSRCMGETSKSLPEDVYNFQWVRNTLYYCRKYCPILRNLSFNQCTKKCICNQFYNWFIISVIFQAKYAWLGSKMCGSIAFLYYIGWEM